MSILRVYIQGFPLYDPSLSAASMSSWASQAHAFYQFVCHRLCWLHPWSIPHSHTSRAFSASEWGPDPQCQAAQIAHWTRWWQCLMAWHCRSVWSLPCRSAADVGVLALSMAKYHWHGTLRSTHKSCARGPMSWKRGGGKRELLTAPLTSSRLFSHMSWLIVYSQLLLRACLLGSKRKLSPPACQVWLGLWSAVQGACSSLAPFTSVIKVLFQVLGPTAFLVHPVFAAIAEDAVASHSSKTDIYIIIYTPQPLYNIIVGVHNINRVSYTTVLYPNNNV